MTEFLDDRPPMSFWFVSGVALIWNLLGFYAYLDQVTASPEKLANAFSPEQIAILQSMPKWATSAFAIAVTTGVLGSLCLLFRKAWAVPLFVISLIAVLIEDVNSFVLNDMLAVFGRIPAIIQAAVLVIGIALILYSRYAKGRRWLR
ncbi:MAG: hypothetical protein WB812_06615 [Woeseiaceae bacterium]